MVGFPPARTIDPGDFTGTAIESQYRSEYLFLVPESYQASYVVIAQRAADPPVTIDGAALPAACVVSDAGTLAGTAYLSRRCTMDPSPRIEACGPGFAFMISTA